LSTEQILDYNIIKKFLKNEVNFRIITLLLVHQELSLSQLALKCKTSKSTILRHVPDLIDSKIIVLSKEQINRGDRPAKYYQLSETFKNILLKTIDDVSDEISFQTLLIKQQIIFQSMNPQRLSLDPTHVQTSSLNMTIKVDRMDEKNPSIIYTLKIPVNHFEQSVEAQISGEKIDEPIDTLSPSSTVKGKDKGLTDIQKEFNKIGITLADHIQREHNKITGLDLNGLNLIFVPESIQNLKELEHLNLENNQIQELPLFIDEMPSLKSLDVSKNPLSLSTERINELNRKFLFYW
jgi:predicted transcriptional regulator